MNNLLRYKKNLKYIVWDTETEGLNLFYTRPWQVSWMVVENGQTVKEYDLFPWIEDLKVSPEAARATHFDYNVYKSKAISAIEVYDSLMKYLENEEYLLVGQNQYYDIHILKSLERYLGLDKTWDFNNRIIDTNCLSKAIILGLTPPNREKIDDYVAWQFSLCNFVRKGLKTNVKATLDAYDISYNPDLLHSSIWDIRYTNEIFKKQIWKLEI